jgi:hypothetical protein
MEERHGPSLFSFPANPKWTFKAISRALEGVPKKMLSFKN